MALYLGSSLFVVCTPSSVRPSGDLRIGGKGIFLLGDLPDTMVDPDIMVDLPDTMVDLPHTMVDLTDTIVDLPDTMVDISIFMKPL